MRFIRAMAWAWGGLLVAFVCLVIANWLGGSGAGAAVAVLGLILGIVMVERAAEVW